jgi:fatty-acyl-CoA synthase
VIHGAVRRDWRETYERCRRLASALARRGIRRGDTVAAMLPNVPAMMELHFGPAMLGAVLNTLNTRLDAEAIAFMLDHGEAKVLFTDREFAPSSKALALAKAKPLVVDVDDALYRGRRALGSIEYEAFLAEGTRHSSGAPAGRVGCHRAQLHLGHHRQPEGRGLPLPRRVPERAEQHPRLVDAEAPVYLWTLPMFHCNGWCFNWTLAAAGRHQRVPAQGRGEADPRPDPRAQGDALLRRADRALDAPERTPRMEARHRARGATCLVAAAPPPAAVIEGMGRMGFDITHVYGLTETYGPAAVCAKHEEWVELPLEEQVRRNGPPGRGLPAGGGHDGDGPETREACSARWQRPWARSCSAATSPMKGYLKNPSATEEAFRGGWFHSGDLAVMQSDGYVKIKDRSKDVIISGGENISSQEVEDVLYGHPAVMVAAVVAQPDPKWGETPCAVRGIEGGRGGDPGGDHRVLPRAHGPLQGAEDGRVRCAAQDLHGQDPEVPAARARESTAAIE